MNKEFSHHEVKIWQGLSFSNLLTYSSFFAGLLGYLLYTKTNDLKYIGLFLCFSFIFDIFDGLFARLFKKRSAFVSTLGGHLDSLTDFAVFGIFPSLAILQIPSTYLLLNILTFCAVLFFAICSMTRLAAFHILTDKTNYFIGLPTTLSGLCLALGLLFTESKTILAVLLLVLSFLMIAPFRISRPGKMGLIFLTCIALIIATFHFQHMV